MPFRHACCLELFCFSSKVVFPLSDDSQEAHVHDERRQHFVLSLANGLRDLGYSCLFSRRWRCRGLTVCLVCRCCAVDMLFR